MVALRDHTHIVHVRGLCFEPPCIVMEFVDGKSLETHLQVGWSSPAAVT
jgi:hypothetical protein